MAGALPLLRGAKWGLSRAVGDSPPLRGSDRRKRLRSLLSPQELYRRIQLEQFRVGRFADEPCSCPHGIDATSSGSANCAPRAPPCVLLGVLRRAFLPQLPPRQGSLSTEGRLQGASGLSQGVLALVQRRGRSSPQLYLCVAKAQEYHRDGMLWPPGPTGCTWPTQEERRRDRLPRGFWAWDREILVVSNLHFGVAYG